MKIDIFCHVTPPKYVAAFEKKLSPEICKQLPSRFIPSLTDWDKRFRVMDQFEDMVQVITLTNPPVEIVAEPAVSVELAKLVNDEMAELCVKYPDRFIGAVACLPYNDMDATLREADRAIKELKMVGVEIYSHVMGKTLDSPELMPLYEKMAQYDLPIWIHPSFQTIGGAIDRAREMESVAFEMTFGTTSAMTRLVYSGLLDKYPNIKFIKFWRENPDFQSGMNRRFGVASSSPFPVKPRL